MSSEDINNAASQLVNIDTSNIDPQVSNVQPKSEHHFETKNQQRISNGGHGDEDDDDSFRSLSSAPPSLLKTGEIFFNEEQGPIKFYIPSNESDRENLITMIEANGGKVVNDYSGYVISHYFIPSRVAFRPELIYDSLNNGVFANLESYRVTESNGLIQDAEAVNLATVIANSNNHTGISDEQMAFELVQQHTQATHNQVPTIITVNKNGFTKEEDNFIMEEVRKNPTRRATHKLFGEIATKLNRHTGNSVRYRFRNHLQKSLGYVYKTDNKGELLVDGHGNYIRTENMPSTVKNKFTSEDDYVLCKSVMQKSQVVEGDEANSVTLPNKFFDLMEKEQPHHSRAAWRDRFRKFARVYGIENYIRYYEECLAQNKIPEPMKDFTARKNVKDALGRLKRPTPGNITSDNHEKEIGADDNIDFNELIGDVRRARSGNKRKKISAVNSSAAAVAVAAAAAASSKDKNKNPADELDSSHLFLTDEHRNELNSLVDSSLAGHQSMLSTNQSSQIPLINRDSSSLAISKLMDPGILLKYFKKEMLSLSLSEVLDLANEIVKRDYSVSGADALLNDLHDELGIGQEFGTELLTSCCGDLSLVTKYLNLVINTGVSPPENATGIWTKDDDKRFQNMDTNKNDYDYLAAKHGITNIALRRSFVASTAHFQNV
ncbi:DNA-binding transcription factor [Saccharomycopsis crataegensis]|uniref:DNA-binding protein RAP1 n=1 Tax=Saccharomycopsis crataegensis TaxID=43959 RepID=A0AAV5QS97_9ASCO|nr:DNA-binding transcription factor [Saccharomycopsis crataegensis]